jgi:hypothetical protein
VAYGKVLEGPPLETAMRDQFDRGSKWIIGHYGSSLLRLGGLEAIRSWRALQAELTHPRQLPDGLLEVFCAEQTDPDLFLIEVSTYSDQRVRDQLVRDVGLVLLDRRVLPEAVLVVLQPRGNVEVGSAEEFRSRLGWTRMGVSWQVLELWKFSAEELLAANDVGLLPLVPLTQFAGPPEVVLQECRDRIEALAPVEEQANLLAVMQVMTRLRYNDPKLLALIGGRKTMIESPLIQELLVETRAETNHQAIVRFLRARFGAVAPEVVSAVQAIQDQAKLEGLIDWAGRCQSPEEFRSRVG